MNTRNQIGARSANGEAKAVGENERPLSRREIISLSIASLAIGGSLTAWARLEHKKQQLLASYGDLDNPRYRVREDLRSVTTPTYQAVLKSKIGRLDVSEEKERSINLEIETYRTELSKVPELARKESEVRAKKARSRSPEELLREVDDVLNSPVTRPAAPGSPSSQVVNRVRAKTQELSRWLNEQEAGIKETAHNDLLVDMGTSELRRLLSAQSYKQQVDRYGPPVSYVKRLVKYLTGTELPDKIDFQIRPIDDPQKRGFSQALSQSIVSEDGYYGRVVLTLAHEAGHLMAPHEEHRIIHGEGGFRRGSELDWEEACAYAFQEVAAEALKKTPLSLAFHVNLLERNELLSDFYEGRKAGECHRVGMAYFDAARTVLGSSAKAYNFLSSHRTLTPEMEQVIEVNRALTNEIAATDNTGSPRLKRLQEKLAELEQSLAKAQQQVTDSLGSTK